MLKVRYLALLLVIAVLTLLSAMSNDKTIPYGILLWCLIGTDILFRTAWSEFVNRDQGKR